MVDIQILPVNKDNYCYLLHAGDVTIAIDPGDGRAVLDCLDLNGWGLQFILSTHMHQDHCQGNLELKQATNCLVIGTDNRILGVDVVLDGEKELSRVCRPELSSLNIPIAVYYTPGHTKSDCCYYLLPTEGVGGALFTGDVLFGGGCGRIFEGTIEQMFTSLHQIKALPPDTMLYYGHEYTVLNYRFAAQLEPDSEVIQEKLVFVENQYEHNRRTIPAKLADELNTNPFLRTDNADLRRALKMENVTELAVFTELRMRRNNF